MVIERNGGRREPGKRYYEDGITCLVSEKDELNIVLQTARDHPHVRRPDGRKSPTLLACEEVERLRVAQGELGETYSKALSRVQRLRDELQGVREVARSQYDLIAELRRPWWQKLILWATKLWRDEGAGLVG